MRTRGIVVVAATTIALLLAGCAEDEPPSPTEVANAAATCPASPPPPAPVAPVMAEGAPVALVKCAWSGDGEVFRDADVDPTGMWTILDQAVKTPYVPSGCVAPAQPPAPAAFVLRYLDGTQRTVRLETGACAALLQSDDPDATGSSKAKLHLDFVNPEAVLGGTGY